MVVAVSGCGVRLSLAESELIGRKINGGLMQMEKRRSKFLPKTLNFERNLRNFLENT